MEGEPERKEASAFTKFRLLMWKNFLIQWRHPGQTIAELFVPVAAMSLVLVLRAEITPETRGQRIYTPINAGTLYPSNNSLLIMRDMNLTRLSIAYSPTNPILENVVRDAVSKLFLNNVEALYPIMIELFPDLGTINVPWNSTIAQEIVRSLVKVDAYDRSEDLNSLYGTEERTHEVFAAIEFPDSFYNETSLPEAITYEIRFPEIPRMNSFYSQGARSWRTTAVFPSLSNPGPRHASSNDGGLTPGYMSELFIALQHSISMELISRLTGQELDIDVYVQRYPHPPYLYDLANTALSILFPMFIVLSFSYTAINIVRAITLEKELQLKEAMKIMGLPSWLHWTAWFSKQFIYLCISTVLLVILLKVPWFSAEGIDSKYGVFDSTPWTVLVFFFLLYFASMIFLCFMISGIFSKAGTAALFAGVLWFVLQTPALLLSMDEDISMVSQLLACLSINCAVSFGFQIIMNAETTGGLQWGSFFEAVSADNSRLLFGHVVIMLAVDCVLFMLIALYLEQVFPGPFGTPKPWYFLFKKEFWITDTNKISTLGLVNNGFDESQSMKEEDPKDLTIGVKISNLTKIFGSNIAVNDLSLNIYNDQITVLLGHNGAGKSTTMAILTGNVKASSGSVWLAGYDVERQGSFARAKLGFCPQHNVLFNELTVKEHLEFFARLKGREGKELNNEIDSLISKLELQEKMDAQSQGLSGGQKRRLCVGIALSGGATVVLLDEPTSGMDPASRRALWTLLQKEKQDRSIILTTHFMDEADYLGDRVAIMLTGRLQCVGSPFFLKRKYGVGYTLTVVKGENFHPELCTDVISNYIPETDIKEERGTEISYTLLNEYSHTFEEMLKELEQKAEVIGLTNYGLTATTLEDVFMAAGSDVHHDEDDSTESVDSSGPKYDGETSSIDILEGRENLITGPKLIWQHTYAVWFKLFLVWTRSWGLLTLQILVPIVLVNMTLSVFTYMLSMTDGVVPRALTLREGFIYTETFLSNMTLDSNSTGARAAQSYESLFDTNNMLVTSIGNQDMQNYYLNLASDSMVLSSLRHQTPIGATFTDHSITAWFSNFGYHDVAISVATVHNAILKSLLPNAEINVANHPLKAQYNNTSDMQLVVTMLSMQLTNGIGTCLSIITAVFIMFYIKERSSRAKLLQKASGIEPAVLWGSAAVFDWIWFLLIGLTIVVSCLAFRVIGMSSFDELGRFYLILMVYGFSTMPLMYIMSYFFSGPAFGFAVVTFINILLGLIGPQIVEAVDTEPVPEVLDAVLQFYPLYSAVTAMKTMHETALMEWSCLRGCSLVEAVLPNATCTMQTMCDNNFPSCCIRPAPHFDWESPGVLRYICSMLGSGVVFWVVLMCAEYRLHEKITCRKTPPPSLDLSELDEDVAAEVEHANAVGGAVKQHNLVARGLTKYYKKNLAVNQVSFTVGEMECFGLLGVNGAGKTTTFKMLMGDEAISAGDAYVRGHSVKTSIKKVHENIGYCPQFDAVFPELTGRETLRLFSLLRGLRPAAGSALAAHLADTLGFTQHLDKRVRQYSGGNKRKLSTAIALLGYARVIFLDEPTTGVDPAAKRQVWSVVRRATNAGRSVVLTSHSMEECEALCSRLAIMVNGQFKCLGTPQHLKNKFSEGFTLHIKLKPDGDDLTEATNAVKAFVDSTFTNPKLMEEYYGVLTYYLPASGVAWWWLFGTMERAKQQLRLEDYSLAQTTLEQVFLQFTKYQRL